MMRDDTSRQVVLLIGGSFSAVPIAEFIKRAGFKLIVISGDEREPVFQIADSSVISDYSKIDVSLDALVDIQFDFVVPSCNDSAYLLGSRLAEIYEVPGFDTLEICDMFSSKQLFRKVTRELQIPAPIGYSKEEILDNFDGFPVIIKPNASFSGRGISIVRKSDELLEAIRLASENSKDGTYAIESFVEGTLHSISAFIINRSIVTSFYVDEFCTVYPYQVNNSNYPSSLGNEIRREVESHLRNLIERLELVDGLIHLQFLVDKESIYFIEIMRRCPGDLYGQLFSYSFGFNYYEAYASAFLRMSNLELLNSIPKDLKAIGRSTETSAEERMLVSLSVCDSRASIYPLASSGDRIAPAPYGKTAILFIEFENQSEMYKLRPNFDKYMSVEAKLIGVKVE